MTWKLQRLKEIGFSIPDYVHFVPVDFETSYWWKQLMIAGFNLEKSAVVAFTGVTSYLSKEAIIKTLRQISGFAADSKLAMTFYLPIELLDDIDKTMQEIAENGARDA